MPPHQPTRTLRPLATLVVVLTIGVSACSSSSKSPAVASVTTSPTTKTGQSSATSAPAKESLAAYQAFAQCMRSHGVPNFPDPVTTPGGGYGFQTQGVDPKAPAFRSAGEACRAQAPEGWGGGGKALTPAQQQQWLDWAKCVRTHGAPGFPDPTFGEGGSVGITQSGQSSPQVSSAMDVCKSKMPTTGGLGG